MIEPEINKRKQKSFLGRRVKWSKHKTIYWCVTKVSGVGITIHKEWCSNQTNIEGKTL